MKIKIAFFAALAVFLSAQQRIGGELQDAALENLAADPGSGNIEGRIFWDSDDNLFRVYDGSSYQTVWPAAAGGDVTGPGSSTDNAITRFDSTTGKLLQNSVVLIDDVGEVTGVADMEVNGFNGSWITDPLLSVDGNVEFQPTEFVVQSESGDVSKYIEFYFDNGVGGADIDFYMARATGTGGRAESYLKAGGQYGWEARADSDTPTQNFTDILGVGGRIRLDADALRLEPATGKETRLYTPTGTNYIALEFPTGNATWSWDLPPDDGDAGQVLATDGSGVTDWTTPHMMSKETADPCDSGTPANTEGLQFYNDTSDYMCFCNGTGDDKQVHSPATDCF